MSAGVITFDHVWKKFQKGERHTSLRDLIPTLGRKLVAKARQDELREQEFWAVRDVSFEVAPRRGAWASSVRTAQANPRRSNC